jgi:hypothetical protein
MFVLRRQRKSRQDQIKELTTAAAIRILILFREDPVSSLLKLSTLPHQTSEQDLTVHTPEA